MIIELTNRCNLRCQHCFAERHAATGTCRSPFWAGTRGGERLWHYTSGVYRRRVSTIHRQFPEIVARCATRTTLGAMVSNGLNFPQIYPLLLRSRPWFTGVTFSLDGAREATHDQPRGFRRLPAGDARDQLLCRHRDSLYAEYGPHGAESSRGRCMVGLATRLGSRGGCALAI